MLRVVGSVLSLCTVSPVQVSINTKHNTLSGLAFPFQVNILKSGVRNRSNGRGRRSKEVG